MKFACALHTLPIIHHICHLYWLDYCGSTYVVTFKCASNSPFEWTNTAVVNRRADEKPRLERRDLSLQRGSLNWKLLRKIHLGNTAPFPSVYHARGAGCSGHTLKYVTVCKKTCLNIPLPSVMFHSTSIKVNILIKLLRFNLRVHSFVYIYVQKRWTSAAGCKQKIVLGLHNNLSDHSELIKS
jgi:hypothetical protein